MKNGVLEWSNTYTVKTVSTFYLSLNFFNFSLSFSMYCAYAIALAKHFRSRGREPLWQLYPPRKTLFRVRFLIFPFLRPRSRSAPTARVLLRFFFFFCAPWPLLRVPAGARACPPTTLRVYASLSPPASSSAPASLSKRRVWRRLVPVESGPVSFILHLPLHFVSF